MKYSRWITILLMQISLFASSHAQSIYYDAMKLSTLVKGGVFDSSKEKEYCEILERYLPNSPGTLTLSAIQHAFKDDVPANKDYNPFIAEYIQIGAGAGALTTGSTGEGNILGSIAGLNVATFADGLAKFLVERTKTELNVAFFEKFKAEIAKYPEFEVLFPTTAEFVRQIESYQYAVMLQTLKEAFRNDLRNLVFHIDDIFELPKYQAFALKYPVVPVFANALKIVPAIAGGEQPVEIVRQVSTLKNLDRIDTNFFNTMKVIHLLSESLRDTSATSKSGWVGAGQIRKLVDSPVALNMYCGLLYEQGNDIVFTIGLTQKRFRDMLVEIRNSLERFQEMKQTLVNIGVQVSRIEKVVVDIRSKSSDSLTYQEYYQYFSTTFDVLDKTLLLVDEIGKAHEVTQGIRRFISIGRRGAEIYRNVGERNYSAAVTNLVVVYSYVMDEVRASEIRHLAPALSRSVYIGGSNEDEIISRAGKIPGGNKEELKRELSEIKDAGQVKNSLLRYGAFIAAVAEAKNSDEVKNAIESAALPVGSYSIKRNSTSSIALNSFVGIYGAFESVKQGQDDKHGANLSLIAPIGIGCSWGLGNQGSLELNLGILDLGAVASLRFADDTTKTLPAFKLENIFAPSFSVSYGFPGSPILIAGTLQYGPQLRSISSSGTELETSTWRLGVALAVDLPLLSLYANPR